MQLRRPLALITGALVLSVGGLTSCGFDLATDRPYTPGQGVNAREGQVKLLSAVVVAAQPNERARSSSRSPTAPRTTSPCRA